MGRPRRTDSPGRWHHVMNRAVGRRTMFESARDVHRFLDRLAETVDAGGTEVHSFAVLQTHFHLLVRSIEGRLSQDLHFLQAPYARWFNWSRERDGPLHRGRFLSKPVDSLRYRYLLVRYIDANPIGAGLCARADAYPHGSAFHYARESGPAWLTRSWVETAVARRAGVDRYRPADYHQAFPAQLSGEHASLMEIDACRSDNSDSGVDHLLTLAKDSMAAWIHERARLADGTRALRPIVAPESVLRAVDAAGLSPRPIGGRGRSLRSPRNLAAALMLRTLAGHGMADIGRELGCRSETAGKLCRHARDLAQSDGAFRQTIALQSSRVVRQFWNAV